jgi:AcrR family transcriptional regulator
VARNQRERILHATIQAVCEFTYPATTVREIIAYAGVSERTFYRHFRDREHAAIEANELMFGKIMAAGAGAFFAASGWPERVWAIGHAMNSFWAANPAMTRVALVEYHAISPAVTRHLYTRLSVFDVIFEDGYSYRAQNRQLPRLCTEVLVAFLIEFGYRGARCHPCGAELLTMMPFLTYVVLAPFLGPERAVEFVQAMTTSVTPGRHRPSDPVEQSQSAARDIPQSG